MSKPACSSLFVYGTLMSSANGTLGRAQRVRLQREGRSLGAATMQGRLYDIGRYPGLVPPLADGEIVHGELIELADPETTLAWLDAYEGIVTGRHTHNQYERMIRTAYLVGDEGVEAWVYVFCQSLAGKHLLPGGRWSAQAG